MKTNRLIIAAILCALLLMLAGWTFIRTQTAPRWKYITVHARNQQEAERTLNSMGGLGWELVTSSQFPSDPHSGVWFYLKRQRQ